ncbi:MAG: zinc-binding dehydrogenase [Cyclobacteriaceae bacterium]|nr:zinc-binding dehydrogenase [Cyclobacteriaceae bacterium]
MYKRKVWKVSPKAGSFDNLHLIDEEVTPPGKGEVLIDVKAVGLNFADIFAIFGLYGATPQGEFIPGLEYAGEIIEIGEGVTAFKPGQRVMGVTRFGGYVSKMVADARYVTAMPDDWTYEMGAAYLVQVLTAYYALTGLADIKQNDTVLIQSAAGGVGIWANRIAKQFDAFTIGTVGGEGKLEVLKKEGYNQGIVRNNGFATDLKTALDGRDLNIVMDCIGGEILMESYKQMAVEGRMVVYGSARYAHPGKKPKKLKLLWKFLNRPKIDPQRLIEQNKALMGFNLIYLFEKADRMKEYLEVLDKMNLGKPLVGHTFAFSEMKEALHLFLSGKTVGKVVLRTE